MSICEGNKSIIINWSKEVKPHVSFSHRHNVKFPKFKCLFQKYLKQLKALMQLNSILGVVTQSFN